MGSTSRAAQMLERELGPNGSDSGWWVCQRWYSVRRSKVRECCRYAGSTTALSRASRGSCTRRSHESNVTKANSRCLLVRCSWANASNREIASRKVPAVRTCSHVRVVKLAIQIGQPMFAYTINTFFLNCSGTEQGKRTAEGGDGRVDRLDEDTFTVQL